MAYPDNAVTYSGQGTGSGSAFSIPAWPSSFTYSNDDVICIVLSQDTATATVDLSAASKTAGWATSSGASGATPTSESNCVLAYKKASGVESPPSFACANQALIYTAFVLKDVDTTTQIDVASSNASGTKDWTTANTAAAPSVTASGTDSLAIYVFCCDAAQTMRLNLDDAVGIARYAHTGNSVSHIIGYQQLNSTTVPTPTMYTIGTANGGNKWTIVFKNKSGGALSPQLRGTIQETDSGKLANWYGELGIQHNAVTWQAPSNFAATINGVTVSTNAPTVTSGTITASAWGTGSVITNGTNANEITGGTHAITSANYSGKTLAFLWAISGSNSTGARINTDGALLGLSDGTNYSVYQLASKAKGWISGDAMVGVVDLSTATPLYTSGTLDLTAVTRVAYLWHRASGSATTDAYIIKNMMVIDSEVMTGGGSTRPLTFVDLWYMLQSWDHFRLCTIQGSSHVALKFPLQIGDGSNVTYFDSSGGALGVPQEYSLTTTLNWQQDWNVGDNGLDLSIKTGATDTLWLTSGVAETASAQTLTINAASKLGADFDFGQSFSGWTITDNAGVPWGGSVVKNGGTFTVAGGGDLANCTIAKTTSANAALAITANGSTLDGTTIDVTGTSAAYHIELGTAVTAITLTDVTFTGTPGTDKVHVLKTTGTVKITISGTTSLVAGDVTSAGATVVIAAPELYQSAAITGLAATYRIQLFDIEYDLTVSGITVTPTAGATYTHNGITWTVRSTSIVAGAGTMTVYGAGTPSASGTLTKASGTGDASVTFSAYVVDGTELYIGVPGATSYTWTDSVEAAAPRVIRLRVMEDGPGTADAILMIDSIIGVCGITEGAESVGYLVAAVADDVYNDRGVDGSTVTGITIDDSTLRLEIASGTIVNYNGTDVLVIDGRDIYAYETYWLGTTAGMRDQARFIEAVDAVNFRCSNFKLLGTSGYPIMIRNCYMVDAATGIFASLVDYSGDPISNAPDHMAAIVVSTSDSVVTGSLSEFIAAVPTANAIAQEVVTGITF